MNENLETSYILPILKLFQMYYHQIKITVTEYNHDQLIANLSRKIMQEKFLY